MNLFAMMNTSGDAMRAERMRAEVVAANMANAETTHTATGETYRRQHVVFASNQANPEFLNAMNPGSAEGSFLEPGALNIGGLPAANSNFVSSMTGAASVIPGVHIAAVVQDQAPPLRRYDPGHPDAGPDGYVEYPDINPLTEMVDLMGATRAYGLNGSAVQAEKSMITSALEIAKT
jgi:flagellar basal-body rod protein FlgC